MLNSIGGPGGGVPLATLAKKSIKQYCPTIVRHKSACWIIIMRKGTPEQAFNAAC